MCGLLLVTFLIYLPGLTGEFIFDDTLNIVLNFHSHLETWSLSELEEAWNSGIASQFGRPLSMMSFALNHYFSGLDSWYYKLTNVVIHLANTIAIYLLTIQLLRIGGLTGTSSTTPKVVAVIIAACWALHPLQVSTVLYVVQRMTQLAMLATVLSLILYCKVRQRSQLTYPQAVAFMLILGLLTLVGILFKENAALIPLFIAVIELFLFRTLAPLKEQRFLQVGFLAAFLFVPGILATAYMLLNPEWLLAAYAQRDFTLTQRLLTESRVVWDYISWVLAPTQDDFLFFYENYPVSRSLLDPLSTVFAIGGLVVLATASVLLRKRFPFLCFGIAFFLAGHTLESTVLGLELVFEHRNYLPAYGLIFGVVAGVCSISAALQYSRTVVIVGLLVISMLGLGTFVETRKWSDTFKHYQALLQRQPDSRRLNYDLGHMYFRRGRALQDRNLLNEARSAFIRSSEADDRLFGPLSGLLMVDGFMGEATPEVYRSEFLNRLRNNPISDTGFLELHNLALCHFSNLCKLDAVLLSDMINAVAGNTVTSAIGRQSILGQLGTELLVSFKRIDDALAIYYLAESLSENVTLLDVQIILLELEQARTDAAATALRNARQKQMTSPVFAASLDDLERQIQQRVEAR